MPFAHVQIDSKVATVRMERGKVHAFNEAATDELAGLFDKLSTDENVDALVITGTGKFFSFGFDVPELFDYPRDDMRRFLEKFTTLCARLYTFPKPVVAALNGHTMAGGCVLALFCDRRVVVEDGAKIALNEIAIGAGLFAGTLTVLRATVGQRNAELVALSGKMYSPEEALQLGLVDHLAAYDDVLSVARNLAAELASNGLAPFAQQKGQLRQPIVNLFMPREREAIESFLDVWYSEETRQKLLKVVIKS